MSEAELVERVARAIDPDMNAPEGDHPEFVTFREMRRGAAVKKATAAIAAARDTIRREALEEAARVAADPNTLMEGDGYRSRFNQGARIAAAIRALIGKGPA